MDYAEYARGISFRLLQPDAPRPAAFRALDRLARRAGLHLEMWMTALPEGQVETQRRLRRACRLPRRSTFAVGALINRGVDDLPSDQACLCLGIGAGFELFAAMSGHRRQRCIGVDPFAGRALARERFLQRFERWSSRRHEFHQQPLRHYLENCHQGPIGFCVCARQTTFDNQRDLLRALEPHLADGAVVLLRDANRIDVRRAAQEFVKHSPFHYETLLDVRTPRAGHPTFGDGVLLLARRLRRAAAAPLPLPERRAA